MMASKKIRVADYLIQRLADEGVQDIFLLPGGGAMHLNDAIACEKRITPIPCHHEQACGIAAEAYGRTHPCLLYTSPSPRDRTRSRMPSSA